MTGALAPLSYLVFKERGKSIYILALGGRTETADQDIARPTSGGSSPSLRKWRWLRHHVNWQMLLL